MQLGIEKLKIFLGHFCCRLGNFSSSSSYLIIAFSIYKRFNSAPTQIHKEKTYTLFLTVALGNLWSFDHFRSSLESFLIHRSIRLHLIRPKAVFSGVAKLRTRHFRGLSQRPDFLKPRLSLLRQGIHSALFACFSACDL